MLVTVFETVLRMSIYGSIGALGATLFSRLLDWKRLRAPRWIALVLWGMVGLRFVCPVSVSSAFSFLNLDGVSGSIEKWLDFESSYTGDFQAAPEGTLEYVRAVEAGSPVETTEYGVRVAFYQEEAGTVLPPQTVRETKLAKVAVIWLCGVGVLWIWGMVSYTRLKYRLRFAVKVADGIYEADTVNSPCVMGILSPKIYLTLGLTKKQQEHIIIHERMHIRYGDMYWKLLSYLVFSIHWFNPVMWLFYRLVQLELEKACDERVVRKLGAEQKEDYGESLLALSRRRDWKFPAPIAFSENHTKKRIGIILKYKKPLAVVSVLCILMGAVLVSVILTEAPVERTIGGSVYQVEEILYDNPLYNFAFTPDNAPEFGITSDYQLFIQEMGQEESVEAGGLRESKDNLKWLEEIGAGDIRKDIRYVWESVPEGNNNARYQVLQDKSGKVYLAWKNEEDVIRFLFLLEPVKEGGVDWEDARSAVEQKLAEQGISGEVNLNCYNEVGYQVLMGYDLKSGENGFAVFAYQEATGEFGLSELYGPFAGSPDAMGMSVHQVKLQDLQGETVYDVVLLKNAESVKCIRREYVGAEGEGSIAETGSNLVSLGNMAVIPQQPEMAGNYPVKWTCLDAASRVVMSKGMAADGNMPEGVMETAVSRAILNFNATETGIPPVVSGSVEAHTILGTEESGGKVTAYVMALYERMEMKNGKVWDAEGSHMPVAITFTVSEDGSYECEEYWIPQDGSYYMTSIQEKFPEELWEDALDTQKFIEEHKRSCYEQIVKRWNLDEEGRAQ